MNVILDSLFLRRPRIEYVSPPICEALFSSTGFPTIFLEPFENSKGPTGVAWSDQGFRFFTWPRVPGEICHNVYVSPGSDPHGTYSIISECIPPGVIAICSAGAFYVTATLSDGSETLPGPIIVSDGSRYIFIPLPQYPNQVCSNLYKNGVRLWTCFGGDSFEVCGCGPACYRVSSITRDGETALSDPICYTGSVGEQTCPDGFTWNPDTCVCDVTVPPGPCPEQACPPGFHWDLVSCSCVANPPPAECGPHWTTISWQAPVINTVNGGTADITVFQNTFLVDASGTITTDDSAKTGSGNITGTLAYNGPAQDCKLHIEMFKTGAGVPSGASVHLDTTVDWGTGSVSELLNDGSLPPGHNPPGIYDVLFTIPDTGGSPITIIVTVYWEAGVNENAPANPISMTGSGIITSICGGPP
jgi:hypothetical protein